MKHKNQIFAGAAAFVLAIPVICDGLVGIGLVRGWQYFYNTVYFLSLPFLIAWGLKEEKKDGR